MDVWVGLVALFVRHHSTNIRWQSLHSLAEPRSRKPRGWFLSCGIHRSGEEEQEQQEQQEQEQEQEVRLLLMFLEIGSRRHWAPCLGADSATPHVYTVLG